MEGGSSSKEALLLLVEELLKMGALCYERQHYKKARENFESALEIQRKYLDEDDLAVADTLNDIGNVLMWEGKLDEALEKLNTALPIRVKKLGNHRDTAQTSIMIGNILEVQGNYEKGEEMFRKGLDIKCEILPNDHDEVTEMYQSIALSLKKQGKFSEATKMLKVQLAKLLDMHGEYHRGVVLVYDGIAELLALQNRPDDALQMLDRGIEICNRLTPLGDPDTKKTLEVTLTSKADILLEQGNFEATTEVLNKLLGIKVETDPTLFQTYEQLATVYGRRGMIEDARKALKAAIDILRKGGGHDHPIAQRLARNLAQLDLEKMPRALNEQGLAMKAEGESEKAVQLFQQALDSYMEIAVANPSNIAEVYENLSAVKVEQGFLEDALVASSNGLKIRRRTLGDDHVDTKRRMEAHRSLLIRHLENRS
ncbi:unnamed protein product [Cylindrotheca closterium]|uniref:MalT-like TPR region domain-containing protein n=1 Tax=Cylindrotheca closterium TaxID=2856 RepID=A0AAD2GC10_9STRA|nr:unnamed protein product [Cylindrotheca closterium]